jgi:hypothetical protein
MIKKSRIRHWNSETYDWQLGMMVFLSPCPPVTGYCDGHLGSGKGLTIPFSGLLAVSSRICRIAAIVNIQNACFTVTEAVHEPQN